MRVLVCSLIVLGAIIAGIVAATPLSTFIDVPSLIIVIVPVLAALVGKLGLDFYTKPKDEICSVAGNTAMYAGAIGTVIGLVQMLQNLSDPSAIGPAMAVSLLTMFYGMTVYLVCFVIKNEVKVAGLFALLPLFMISGSLLSFMILLLSFSGSSQA
jgi:flagellar motor component MotA